MYEETETNPLNCPLCGKSAAFYLQDKNRKYHQCGSCKLVFVEKKQWLSEKDEKTRYDLHQNSPQDEGYIRFLSRLVVPLLNHLEKYHKKGMDFGCGPGPTLHLILQQHRLEVTLYDKFYTPDQGQLEQQYDFICATEVFEHLHDPAKVIEHLWQLLEAKGVLAIMTKLVRNRDAFSRWHYKNDDTHIIFFSVATFKWLAARLGCELYFYDNDMIILKKNEKPVS